ncbi:MAG: uracil-DNA glycosylase [Beijerinckiaceae bacterium]
MIPGPDISPAVAADILAFYRDHGVEEALDEAAHDRFAESGAPMTGLAAAGADRTPGIAPSPSPRTAAENPAAPVVIRRPQAEPAIDPDVAAADARSVAAACQTLDDLRTAMERFEGCALKRTATQLVFADGNPRSRLMLVGEGPGQEEDRQGLPFVGRSGQLLDRMLKAIGHDRTSVYIANVVPWRPPGNRTPTPLELAICRPFIERQIELVDPDVLVCIGLPSAQTLLGVKDGITKARGRWLTCRVGEREVPAMPVLHPAYLLRSPSHKKFAWRDLKAIRTRLAELPVRHRP